MEYGGMGGGGLTTGGLGAGAVVGGGTVIAALPNTGGSLRVVTIVALISIVTGLVVLISTLARAIASRQYST